MKAKRLKEILTKEAYLDLCKFMDGQTLELRDGEVHIFEDDFMRWFYKLGVVD